MQNAKVIQVGEWSPDGPLDAATLTPVPVPEDATPRQMLAGHHPHPRRALQTPFYWRCCHKTNSY
ncbi:MAG: hypothetical protein M5U34_44225 [Chloroflexi bacterium]|nr:hypothetical protein [Chloroflexota bacterium]